MSRILVIGSTGTVGRQVLSQLVAAGATVRAMTRNPDRALFPPDVEVLRGDLTIPETLDDSLANVDAVFLVWTAPPSAAAPALQRITQRTRRIVFLSAPLKTPHPLFQTSNPLKSLFQQIENFIVTSRVEWTFLRPGMFAANALRWWAPQIQAGDLVRWPYLAAPSAPIDERDIAAVAVRALLDKGHLGGEYVLTGSQSLSQFEQLSIISSVLGRSLRMEEISPEEARRELLTVFSAPGLNMLLAAWAASVGQPAHVISTFEEIIGKPPRTFRQWATDNAANFRE